MRGLDRYMREERVPTIWEICYRCEGEGNHVNPAVDGNGITPDQFNEDPDFEAAYFSGVYDVPCYECDGAGKIRVLDEDRATDAQKQDIQKWVESDQETEAIRQAEMRMGA